MASPRHAANAKRREARAKELTHRIAVRYRIQDAAEERGGLTNLTKTIIEQDIARYRAELVDLLVSAE